MPREAGAVKTAAALDASSPTQQGAAQKKVTGPLDSLSADAAYTEEQQETEWYNQQQRHEQRDDPAGGPSTSSQQALPAQRHREHSRVKFATSEDDVTAGAARNSGSPGPTAVTANGHAQQQQQQRGEDEPAASSRTAGADAAAEGSPARGSFFSRMKKSLVIRSGHEGNDGSGTNRVNHGSSAVSQVSQAEGQMDWTEPGSPRQGNKPAPSEHSQAVSSFSLKGLLGGASSRLLGSLMGRMNSTSKNDAEDDEEEELWFTSLDDFKPICHMLHRGHYMTAYFACANKTGQHFLLKKYDKHKMVPAEERGVRRAIAFSELLHHPNLVRCVGQWEEADTIYVVEEYVGKGDIFNDCISHPEKYTERHVAVALVKPLLKALAYLHANNIIHRSVLPENLYMGIDDVLRLGHLTLSADQLSDRPKSRTALLDYMAPEMLSVKPHNEHELALGLLDDTSSEEDELVSPTADADTAAAIGCSGHALNQQQVDYQQQQAGEARVSNSSNSSGGGQQPALRQQHSQQQLSQADSQAKVAAEPKGKVENNSDGDAVVREASRTSSHHMRSGVSFSLAAANEGRADWEYRDYYDEKVDIWQVGCMVHELLCGSMPFEVESKIDSAGLALWADIEQPPGSLPPDCVNFIQLTLTKDPRQRPSAETLLEHPWLARCEAGEPWRDPAELAAARKAAELATVWGWLRHNSRAAAGAVGSLVQYITHGRRVSPLISSWEQQQQQQQNMDGTLSGPASPSKIAAASFISFNTVGTTPSFTGQNGQFGHLQTVGGGITAPRNSLAAAKQGVDLKSVQQSAQGGGTQLVGAVNSSGDGGVQLNSSERPAIVPLLKLTEEVVGRLNAGWNAAHESHTADEDHVDGYVAAACVVKAGNVIKGVGTAGKGASVAVQHQQQQVVL